ncbi:methionine--tRNA ligase, mitochondrial-like isoform X1 [Tigriopus californicus]|uniref:methionine--tRNA ligase, mitochondrial-like isoform X1 n=1 Tax=Tigriopus californicus TaxID=6832 RepID=UPI0027DA9D92|nr:methionine--tRNA ligase, mitochondrial-like isoform X1 [Tigriopus californicus]
MNAGISARLITTPIYYANGPPHIGHLYSTVLADAFHRYQRLLGRKSILTTGTDEHGSKIQKKAMDTQQDPRVYVNHISSQYRALFEECQIDFQDFIRTTDSSHLETVQQTWSKMSENGFISKKQHSGWYCLPDEAFVPEDQTELVNGNMRTSKESGHPLEWTEEDNYTFSVCQFQETIHKWLKDNRIVKPHLFMGSLDSLFSSPIPDLSLSRPTSRVSWGIPVPQDPTQTIYVWFDALLNYLTMGQKHNIWPADVHVVGKDILKFHAIYFPAFLLANDLALPKRIFCHSHWTVDHKKMSKSLNNVVDPRQAMSITGPEGLRYYLLRQGVPGYDNNFDEDKLVHYFNQELADTLGNLLSRCTGAKLNPEQIRKPVNQELLDLALLSPLARKIVESQERLPNQVTECFEEFNFYQGITAIMDLLRATNTFVHEEQPWKMKDNPSRRDLVIHLSLESLRIAGILLQPIIPVTRIRVLVSAIPRHPVFGSGVVVSQRKNLGTISYTIVSFFGPNHLLIPQTCLT